MDDIDKQTTEGAHVFTFLTKSNNDTFGGLNLSDRTTTETNADNKLIDALGSDFLSNGVISHDGVGEKIEVSWTASLSLSTFECDIHTPFLPIESHP